MAFFGLFGNNGRKRTGNKMNMAIARTNQFSTRLVGMQLTLGTIIGVCLSMTQLSSGFVFITGFTDPWGIAAIALIGCLVAVLVESLSIGGLGAVREANARQKKFLDNFYSMRREPTQQQLANKERKAKEHGRELWAGWSFAGVGILLSVVLGDTFWEKVFSHLQDLRVSIPLSLMVASVITLTFVRNELFHGSLLKILRMIIRDNSLMKTAVNVEPENMQLDIWTNVMADARDDEEIIQPSEVKLGRALRKQLSSFASNITSVSELDENAVEGSLSPARLQLPAPRPRGAEYMRLRGQLKQYLADHPGAPASEVAKAFDKPKSTIQRWMEKVSTEL